MKKQSILALLALCALSACPANEQTASESTAPSNAPVATPTPTAIPVEVLPSIKPLTELPKNQLTCCWEDFQPLLADYQAVALKAFNGDEAALKSLLELNTKIKDMQIFYQHGVVLAGILSQIGDLRFARSIEQNAALFQQTHPVFEESLRDTLRNQLEGGFSLNQAPPVQQATLDQFPATSSRLGYEVQGK